VHVTAEPDPRTAEPNKAPGKRAGKFQTIVRAKRDPLAEARGTADRGTGTKAYSPAPTTSQPPPQVQAPASRVTYRRAIDPAVSQRPAPNAFRGTELYYIVGDKYFRGTSTPLKVYKSSHYWVVPQVQKDSGEVVAYVAYNPELRRNEFVVGPEDLVFFLEHESLYKWLASSTYPIVGEPRPYEVQHGRMIASAFRGNMEGVAQHFGAEWGHAVNDPVWYVRGLGGIVGMKTAPVTSESATIASTPGMTTSTEPPVSGATTSTLPPSSGAASSTASSTGAATAARASGITPPQGQGAIENPPMIATPVAPAPGLQAQGAPHSASGAKLDEPSEFAYRGPLTPAERLRAERLLNRSLGQVQNEPVPVTRWGGQSQTVATRVIKVGPDGRPLVVEFTGRGVNGELVTVVSTANDGGGRVVRLNITNINNLERVARDTELARAMKAAGMGDWERNLGHVQPSAAKGPRCRTTLRLRLGNGTNPFRVELIEGRLRFSFKSIWTHIATTS
jgi:hypothetical protein